MQWKSSLAVIGLMGLMSLQIKSQIQLKALVITHVTVVDVRDGRTRPDMTVVISGNRIVEMGEAGRTNLPKDAQVIDESGRYLIPGLWDMHVHLGNATEAALPLLVASGITGVRDMGSPSFETLRRWRAGGPAGSRVGPRIGAAGPIFHAGAPESSRPLIRTTP